LVNAKLTPFGCCIIVKCLAISVMDPLLTEPETLIVKINLKIVTPCHYLMSVERILRGWKPVQEAV